MKKIIIILGSICLGVIIFGLILGDTGSLKSEGKRVMEKQIQEYKINP